jgi:hypothetical protein
LLQLCKQFLDPTIELCENLEEKELEDELEEKDEKHFLNKLIRIDNTTFSYSITFHDPVYSYHHLYIEDILQPPRKA